MGHSAAQGALTEGTFKSNFSLWRIKSPGWQSLSLAVPACLWTITKNEATKEGRKEIGETASRGPPIDEAFPIEREMRFGSSRAKAVFEYLIKVFIEDHMRRKLSIDNSGWRSLPQLARMLRIHASSMYGRHGEFGAEIKELTRRGLIESRTVVGGRGRGGESLQVRLAYDREPIGILLRTQIANPGENQSSSTRCAWCSKVIVGEPIAFETGEGTLQFDTRDCLTTYRKLQSVHGPAFR